MAPTLAVAPSSDGDLGHRALGRLPQVTRSPRRSAPQAGPPACPLHCFFFFFFKSLTVKMLVFNSDLIYMFCLFP